MGIGAEAVAWLKPANCINTPASTDNIQNPNNGIAYYLDFIIDQSLILSSRNHSPE
jgi:hypothetical protein